MTRCVEMAGSRGRVGGMKNSRETEHGFVGDGGTGCIEQVPGA